MTYQQFCKLRLYDVVSLGTRKYHIIQIHVGGASELLVMIADRDWSDYMKHFRIVDVNGSPYTQAEVERIPMPEPKEFRIKYEPDEEYTSSMRLLRDLEIVDEAKS